MSYEVIARRWRPQDFQGLIGQDHIRTTLQNALKNDRLHHALLFTGPRGTGKTSTARISRQILELHRRPERRRVRSRAGNARTVRGDRRTAPSMDVMEIDGASNNSADRGHARAARRPCGYAAVAAVVYKLYIIDEVHMLSNERLQRAVEDAGGAAAPRVVRDGDDRRAEGAADTILSRCQRFDFRRIPTRVIAGHLQTICERDGVKFEIDALWTIARQGDGSMRDAQSLLDQVINFTGADLRRDLVVATLGLTDRGLLLDILAGLMRRQVGAVISGIQRLHQSGGDPKLFLLDVMEQIRNALLLKLGADRAMIDLPDSEQEALVKMAQPLSAEDLHLLFDMALKGSQDLVRASDTLLILEMVLMRLASAPSVATLVGQPQPAPQILAQDPNTPSNQRFRELVEKIKEVNGLIGAQLENCFVLKIEHKILTLGISAKHRFLFDKLNQPDFKKKVVNYLQSFWGPGYSLDIQLSESGGSTEDTLTPKALGERQEEDRQQNLRKAIEAHPLVQSTQSVFKTEIKSIKELKQ
jgi:DNA polymerase-3 subunit gamma/tau